MAAVSVHPGQPVLMPNTAYHPDTSPHGSSSGTNRDEPYIDSMSPSPTAPHISNHAGPSFSNHYDVGMPRMNNAGRRASSPAALYQQSQMMSFAAPEIYSYGNGYAQQVPAPYGPSAQAQGAYPLDRPPMPNHSLSHSVGPSVPVWHQNGSTVQSRAAQNGMNASSFRRGSLGGNLTSHQEHGISGYNSNGAHVGLDFHNQFHHSTMYDTYQVKHRKRTSPEQLSVLEKSFDENCKPSAVTRKMLADQIGMTPRSVQVWFQNRRQKRKMLDRKKAEEDDDDEADPVPTQGYPAMLHIRGDHNVLGHGQRVDGLGPNELDGWSSRHPLYQAPDKTVHSGLPYHPPKATGTGTIGDQHSLAYGYGPAQPLYPQSVPRSGITTLPGRRGSLPYPPPIVTNTGSRLVSPTDRPAKSQIPMHLAMTLGGRRASLPVNSRSFSLGSFTPPRTGASSQRQPTTNKRELSPIADQDLQQPFDTSLLAAFSPEEVHGSHDGMLPTNGTSTVPGPLPNPSFSFGYNDPNAPPINVNDSVLPLMTPFADHPGLPSANYMYRNRIGSMTSMFSQETADSNADTIGEYPYAGNFDHDGARILQSDEHLTLPVDFDAGTRRASAPADLLQKVNLSDQKKRQSPLNPTVNYVGNNIVPNEQITEPMIGHSSDQSVHLSSVGSSVASVDSKQPYIYPLTALHDHGDLHGGVNPGFNDLAFQEHIRGTSGYHPSIDETDAWAGIWQ